MTISTKFINRSHPFPSGGDIVDGEQEYVCWTCEKRFKRGFAFGGIRNDKVILIYFCGYGCLKKWFESKRFRDDIRNLFFEELMK